MKTAILTKDFAIRSNGSIGIEVDCQAVSNSDEATILRRAQKIRASWSAQERQHRADQSVQRLDELCEMLFG